ncbi:helix-turn-helix transcriptional regulator [Photobacterium leiognathi subsp. mandapamensis]|uniref:helix-turn-helix transcriptional regulator n=1 Tax=Photobacterium leiognathi TaxID=553611 RepID=UPI003AF3D949
MLKDIIKDARLGLGLKQEDVANEVGVTKQTYLKWENGSTEPRASQVVKLSKALKLSTDEICTGKKNVKYTLDEFIARLSYYRASREIEVMEAWKHIADHEDFFKSVNLNNMIMFEELEAKKEELMWSSKV